MEGQVKCYRDNHSALSLVELRETVEYAGEAVVHLAADTSISQVMVRPAGDLLGVVFIQVIEVLQDIRVGLDVTLVGVGP